MHTQFLPKLTQSNLRIRGFVNVGFAGIVRLKILNLESMIIARQGANCCDTNIESPIPLKCPCIVPQSNFDIIRFTRKRFLVWLELLVPQA